MLNRADFWQNDMEDMVVAKDLFVAALQEMSSRELIACLYRAEGWSDDELCNDFDITQETVINRLKRALRKFEEAGMDTSGFGIKRRASRYPQICQHCGLHFESIKQEVAFCSGKCAVAAKRARHKRKPLAMAGEKK